MDDQHWNPKTAARFLETLFQPGDHILVRPLETWTEDGKKKTKVDQEGIAYLLLGTRDNSGQWQYATAHLEVRLKLLFERMAGRKTGGNFGVCPRLGSGGQYDQAWQIRTIRALWLDLDDCKPDEAIQRGTEKGFPQPTIVVGSGNGTHLYWLLDKPVVIADCPPPKPISIEWTEVENGRKRGRRYILDDNQERLYLDVRSNVPALGANAQHVQDILSGMASMVGGDNTQDLSRLLRLPGTMNQKDARNQRPAVPCVLVDLDAARRYPLASFERFLENSPARIKRQKIAQVPLPSPRRSGTKTWDRLDELISMCATAESGERSEADFAICCFAVEHGISRTEVWARVSGVGKFAEAGEKYFDRTWASAEQHTREKVYERAVAKAQAKRAAAGAGGATGLGKPAQPGAAGATEPLDPLSEDKKICADLGIDVLGETRDGSIKIFSQFHGKTVLIQRPCFQTTTDLIQKIGPLVREKVHSSRDEVPGMHRLQRVQDAIAAVGGAEKAGEGVELGQGVWRTPDDKIILVNPKVSALWDGERLHAIRQPRVGQVKIDMDLPLAWKWYDHDRLAKYLAEAADPQWCEHTIGVLTKIFAKWYWRSGDDMAASLVSGLVLSTFVQACWTWRPLVAITAESDSGKSLLFETLRNVFGALALLNAKSTEAGIRQAVGTHAKAILCDEFESDAHRDKILEFFRTASRGSTTLRGSSHQQAQHYGLRHIPWCAAIGIKLDRAPDRNRFIFLEFVPPPAHKRGKIELPNDGELAELGQKILAIAVRYTVAADRLAAQVKGTVIDGIHGRVVESFATPTAMLATAIRMTGEETTNLLRALVQGTEQDPAQGTKDQTEMLGDLFSSEVYLEHGKRATVSQILSNPSEYTGAWEALERCGITIVGTKPGTRPASNVDQRKSLFIACRQVQRYLLKGTRWINEPAEQILLRLPGATRAQRRVGGHQPRGVDVPWDWIMEKFLRDHGDQESTALSSQGGF